MSKLHEHHNAWNTHKEFCGGCLVDAKKSTWLYGGDEKISNYWDWVINNGRVCIAAASKYY